MSHKQKTKIIRVTLVSTGQKYRTISDAARAARADRAANPGILGHGIVIDRQCGARRWSENEIV